MKKLILAFFLVLSSSILAVASEYRTMYYGADYSASGGTPVTVSITATAGAKIVIHKVLAKSDLSSSILTIQEADTYGTTTNYTTKATLDVGASTKEYPGNSGPLFVGKINYGYKLYLNTTTANSLLVVYSKEQ